MTTLQSFAGLPVSNIKTWLFKLIYSWNSYSWQHWLFGIQDCHRAAASLNFRYPTWPMRHKQERGLHNFRQFGLITPSINWSFVPLWCKIAETRCPNTIPFGQKPMFWTMPTIESWEKSWLTSGVMNWQEK